jgi:hypothetical protein
MAIFHMSVKTVSRGKGQSAIAKAAYNARDKIRDEQTGQMKDYARSAGLMFSAIFAPRDAPAWARDRAALWNAVELTEKRMDAQLAREITLGLPHELTDQQRKQLVTDFVREQFQRKGMVADVSIHAPGGKGDDRNYHAHILLTMRKIGPEGFGPKVRDWNSREQIENWREAWERIQNRYLERHGHEARVDRRTLQAQGVEREPTTHVGPHAHAIEARKGRETERGNIYRDAFTAEQEAAKLKRELAHIEKQIAAAEREARTIRPRETRSGGRRDQATAAGFHKAARIATRRQKNVRSTTGMPGRAAFKLAKGVFSSRSAEHWHKRQAAGGTLRQEPKRGKGQAEKHHSPGPRAGHIRQPFGIVASLTTRNHARHVEPTRPGPMSRGELYEYYKRMGCLDVFYALFPGG